MFDIYNAICLSTQTVLINFEPAQQRNDSLFDSLLADCRTGLDAAL